MANHWPVTVETCADCPLRVGVECRARVATVFLDPRRKHPQSPRDHRDNYFADADPLDVSESIAGAPPPASCLLRALPVYVVLKDWTP